MITVNELKDAEKQLADKVAIKRLELVFFEGQQAAIQALLRSVEDKIKNATSPTKTGTEISSALSPSPEGN